MLSKNKQICIAVSDELIKEAQALCQTKSKGELIELALQEFVIKHKPMDLRELKGASVLNAD